jgi:hypothetical protein
MMTAKTTSTSPLICVPDAIPTEQRAAHFELAAELFQKHAQERTDLPDGFGFRFDPENFEALARFVASERKCCPAVSFSIVVTPDSGPVWLQMQGPEGVQEFLRAELPIE